MMPLGTPWIVRKLIRIFRTYLSIRNAFCKISWFFWPKKSSILRKNFEKLDGFYKDVWIFWNLIWKFQMVNFSPVALQIERNLRWPLLSIQKSNKYIKISKYLAKIQKKLLERGWKFYCNFEKIDWIQFQDNQLPC